MRDCKTRRFITRNLYRFSWPVLGKVSWVVALQLDAKFLAKRGHSSGRGGCATPLLDRTLRKYGSKMQCIYSPVLANTERIDAWLFNAEAASSHLRPHKRRQHSDSDCPCPWSDHINTAPPNGSALTAMNSSRLPKARRWWAA
ncbi:hypothetical protein PMIN06_013093 [Paraphaeosphaeria minitans]